MNGREAGKAAVGISRMLEDGESKRKKLESNTCKKNVKMHPTLSKTMDKGVPKGSFAARAAFWPRAALFWPRSSRF